MEIRAITIKEQVYCAIKQKILDGSYPFGKKLNINAISKEFSVSNSPVREALSLLERDNLVSILPNAGAQVIKMEPEIYHEITDAMQVLLIGAYYMCIRWGKKDLMLKKLNKNHRLFQESISAGDKNDSIKRHLKFYCSFVAATENKQCKSLCQKQFDLFYLADVYNHRNITFDWDNLIENDKRLIQAVQQDDPQTITDLIVQYAKFHSEA